MVLKKALRRSLNWVLARPLLHRTARSLARRELLPARVWTGYPHKGVMRVEGPGASFLYEIHPGDYVGMPIYWRGFQAYEGETMLVFARLAREAAVFYDIGANTGTYSLFAAALNPSLRVWAFEPVDSSFKQLQKNIARNDFGARIQPIQEAVGDTVGMARFYVPDGIFPTSAGLQTTSETDRTTTVRQIFLDDFCKTRPDPDLIKIDVEGFEHLVIGGMLRVLKRGLPRLIVECLHDGPFAEIESLLSPLGYRFGHLTREGIEWRELLRPKPGTARNWLFVAQDLGDY